MMVKGTLPAINVKLTQEVFKKIQKISECFVLPTTVQEVKEQQEAVQTEKQELLKYAKKIGIVSRQKFFVWTKFHCIYSGHYLYFFEHVQSPVYVEYFYVKGSTVDHLDETIVGQSNAIAVKNKYGEIQLSFTNQNKMTEWIDVIQSSPELEINPEDGNVEVYYLVFIGKTERMARE